MALYAISAAGMNLLTTGHAGVMSGCWIAGNVAHDAIEHNPIRVRAQARWRAVDTAAVFRRDWNNATGRHVPMSVKASNVALTPDPLVFPLTLPAVTVQLQALTATPSPLIFNVSLPALSLLTGSVVIPDPLVFDVGLPDLSISQQLTLNPLAFPVTLPNVSFLSGTTVQLDPLVFAVTVPDVVMTPGPISVSPDPLALRLFLPQFKQRRGTVQAGAVVTSVYYDVILTGAEDSTTDVLLPAQSVQATLRQTGNDTLAVYVPGAAEQLPAILARLNGTLIVLQREVYSDGSEIVSEVMRSPITEPIRRDRGPVRDTLTLAGRVPVGALSGTARTLPAVMQLLSQSGSSSFKVPYNSETRPLDVVTYGAYTITVGAIQISLTRTDRSMQLQERALMGKGKIIKALTEGQFTMDYLFNVEFIEFEIARMHLRKAEIEDTALPAAEADLATKEDELTARSEEMDTLLKELNGDVSPAVIAKLQTAVNALANAESTLNAIGTKLATATSNLNSSVAAFPEPAPVEVATAYNAAFTALTTATLERGDEENALNTAQGYANTALNLAQASEPDPDAVRDAIQDARDAMQFVISESAITASAIATASSAVSSAEGSLPGDTSWDLARDYADAAVFQMSNSDPELLGGIGAQPLHGQVAAFYTQANAALLEAADMMVPGKEETGKKIIDKLKEVHAAKSAADLAAMAIDQLNLELSNIEKRLDEFEAIPKEKRNSFWCADYTTELDEEREVGTCEIPGEYEGKAKGEVVIRPGFQDAALDWNQTRDGFMTPVQALTPAGCFYNLAMLPGWQVYRPQFRFAKLTKMNEDDTVNLEIIEPNKSSQKAMITTGEGDEISASEQPIDVTPRKIPAEFEEEEETTKILENVTVQYMDCNVLAFTLDDEVLVEFEARDQTKPKVIGFRKNPRPCALEHFYTTGEELTIPEHLWQRSARTGQLYGNVYWVGEAGAVSWWGMSSRYFRAEGYPEHPSEELFYRGKLYTTPGYVNGAAIHKKHFLIVTSETVDCFSFNPIATLWSAPIPTVVDTQPVWTSVLALGINYGSCDGITVGEEFVHLYTPAPVLFNETGLKAVVQHLSFQSGIQVINITKSEGPPITFEATITPIPYPDENHDGILEEFIGANDDDDDGNYHINTRTTRYDRYCDITGETVLRFDTVEELSATGTHTETVNMTVKCTLGGPTSIPEDEEFHESSHRTWRLLCSQVNFNLLMLDNTTTRDEIKHNYYRPTCPDSEDDDDDQSWQQGSIAYQSAYTRNLIDHLNINGGRVLAVLRFAEGTENQNSEGDAPLAGFHEEATGSSSVTHSGTFVWSLYRGPIDPAIPETPELSVPLGEIPYLIDQEASTAQMTRLNQLSGPTLMFNIFGPYGMHAADRRGHMLASLFDLEITRALPVTLPENTLGNNFEQFAYIGMG